MKNAVFLAQTDTTIGFLSQNPLAINDRKGAKNTKPLLQEFATLNHLTRITRTPVAFRTFIRKAKKTSFILSNNMSFRIIHDDLHKRFLQYYGNLYSSSANPTTKGFSYDFAYSQCDIIVQDKRGLFESKSSRILQLRYHRMKKIR